MDDPDSSVFEELKIEVDKRSDMRRRITEEERLLKNLAEQLELLDIQSSKGRTKAIADDAFGTFW